MTHVLTALVVTVSVLFTTPAVVAEDRQDGRQPFAVVELFTSQGCSSCPPADAHLQEITSASRTNQMRVFPIGFHVDYWDYLGWRDPFASRRYSDRQRRYAQVMRADTIYTPQMIVNGTESFGGYRRDRGKEAITAALSRPPTAVLTITGVRQERDKIRIGYRASGDLQQAVLNVALVERDLRTDVRRGENAGRLLSHDNSVRRFKSIGLNSSEGEMIMDLPSQIDLKKASVIGYIQDTSTLEVRGANFLDLHPATP